MGQMVATGFLSAFVGARVLITGHTGFKGSWLAFLLQGIGADVMGYALPPSQSRSHFAALGLGQSVHHVEGDVRDASKLATVVERFQPEFVFHLAAQALVRRSYTDPRATFETNVMGSVNLLEAVRQCESIRSLVYVTSDKCYENQEWVWGYRENDRLGGRDPYSASKAAAETAFASYAYSCFAQRKDFGAASVRAGNVVGGGDWAEDRIVPDCIRALESGQQIQLRNPDATRPWQHVLGPLHGYLSLAARLRESPDSFSGAWNFGPPPGEVRTVLEVAEGIVARFGQGSISISNVTREPYESRLLQLNCDKANQLLGWRPRLNVDQSLTATTDWYKSVSDGADTSTITSSQLRDYFFELQ